MRALEDLHDLVAPQIEACRDLTSVLNLALSFCLNVNSTTRGNIQLVDYKLRSLVIAAHRGFDGDFVSRFAHVSAHDGTACGRAMRDRRCIVIEDVLADREFEPYRVIADEFGFRAVQSVPLISRGGAFLGVISTHFPSKHYPTGPEIQATKMLAELTATAIIRKRARITHQELIAEAGAVVRSSWDVLHRLRQA